MFALDENRNWRPTGTLPPLVQDVVASLVSDAVEQGVMPFNVGPEG